MSLKKSLHVSQLKHVSSIYIFQPTRALKFTLTLSELHTNYNGQRTISELRTSRHKVNLYTGVQTKVLKVHSHRRNNNVWSRVSSWIHLLIKVAYGILTRLVAAAASSKLLKNSIKRKVSEGCDASWLFAIRDRERESLKIIFHIDFNNQTY